MADIIVAGNRLIFNGKEYDCTIGKGGFSPDKKEGDGATPIGIFPLRECWYRADRLSAPQTQLPLKIIHENDGWCDDPKSPEYNKPILITPPAKESASPSPYRGEGWGGGALLAYAKKLRSNMTDAEKFLWHHLRAHRFAAYGFRRQRPMGGRYIVDFLCPGKKLVIEIDGGQHADSVTDEKRDNFLRKEGYRILRFWNNEVLGNIEGVLKVILEALEGTPSLTLPPIGGGNKESHSFEHLWREDHAYDLIIPIGYNDRPIIPGKGSAIFIHINHDDNRATAGCVALAKSDLLGLLPQLQPDTRIDIKEKQENP